MRRSAENGEEVGNLSFGHGVGNSRLFEVAFVCERLETLGGAEGRACRQVADGSLQRMSGDSGAGAVLAVERHAVGSVRLVE
jgi:hypothetical protein